MGKAPGLNGGCGNAPRFLPVAAAFILALLLCWPGPAHAAALGFAPWPVTPAAQEKLAAVPPASVPRELSWHNVAARDAAAVPEPEPATPSANDIPALSGAVAAVADTAVPAPPGAAAGVEPPSESASAGAAADAADTPAEPAGALSRPDVLQVAAAPESPAPLPSSSPAAEEKNKASLRLFGTVEFRGVLKNMPKWERVVAAENKSRTFDRDLSKYMRGSLFNQWKQLVERVENKSVMDKAKAVTAFFNRWPYRTDQDVYKLPDYWATPEEFLVKSGDCEDFAITKFYALLKLGVPPEDMRIVALRDTIRNLAHAVLVVYIENNAYVLDNLTDMVLSHERYQHYNPQYSVNEIYRWAHVMPKKKK